MAEQQRGGSDSDTDTEGEPIPAEGSPTGIGRRKLAYVAPALMSRAMFYGAAGCGKGNPRMLACPVL